MSTEFTPEKRTQFEQVLSFLNDHANELKRHTILGNNSKEIAARTVFAFFPKAQYQDLLIFSYDDNAFDFDQDLIGILNIEKIKFEEIEDENARELREKNAALNNLPIAVLLVGEQDDRNSICLVTYEDLDPKTLFMDFQCQCIIRRSKNEHLQ